MHQIIDTVVFGLYDFMMQRWQRDLIAKAERTNKLVSELFPRNVKDRLLSHEGYGENATLDGVSVDGTTTLGGGVVLPSSYHSKSRRKPVDHSGPYETKPIADLFVRNSYLAFDIAVLMNVMILPKTMFYSQMRRSCLQTSVSYLTAAGPLFIIAEDLPRFLFQLVLLLGLPFASLHKYLLFWKPFITVLTR